jgi:hypothetical protein
VLEDVATRVTGVTPEQTHGTESNEEVAAFLSAHLNANVSNGQLACQKVRVGNCKEQGRIAHRLRAMTMCVHSDVTTTTATGDKAGDFSSLWVII